MWPTLLLRAAPYIAAAVFAFGAGWSAAWYVQGVRLHDALNKLEALRLELVEKAQKAKEDADRITKETNDAIPKYVAELHAYYKRNPVIRMLPPAPNSGKTDAVPGVTDLTGPRSADNVPAADELARIEAALEQCGETTLMYVKMRDWAREQRRKSME